MICVNTYLVRGLKMNNADTTIESLIESLNKFEADKVKYSFDIEKDGEKYVFSYSLKRAEEDEDE